jgi:chromate reductase, NAD(P)H dehydrogenase (quinone)
MKSIHILALSGSLRKSSYNKAALQALKNLAPDHVEISIGSIAELPLFNPDREGENIPALADLVAAIKTADGLVIASPEYAHGISGPMKNALDWLVSRVEFPDKPIMLINTSPRASHAQQALREVVVTMSGRIIEESCLSIPLLGSNLGLEGIINNREIADALTTSLAKFCAAIVTK